MIKYLLLLRVHHWIKNTFIGIAPFFAGVVFQLKNFIDLSLGFIAFSLVASSVYIINDIIDAKLDAQHPIKRTRPIASGKVKVPYALVTALLCVVLGVSVTIIFLPIGCLYLVLGYLLINILYTFKIKNYPILDVIFISFGFLIRVFFGGVLLDVTISSWLIVMIFLLMLFLGFAKRREELALHNSGKTLRKSVVEYNEAFLSSILTMIAGIIIVSYLMYSLSDSVVAHIGYDNIYFTALFVVVGMIRYLQIIFVFHNAGSPTRLIYTDKVILVSVGLWVLSYFIILYIL